jgi:hypothetical protein
MLTNPDHDPAHLGPRAGQTVDTVDQLSSLYVLGLAVVGALAVVVINVAVGA